MKNKIKKIVLFIFFQVFFFSELFAVTYKSTGTGVTEEKAKDEALSSLSKVLYSKVKTTTYASQEMKEKNSKLKKNKKTLSNSITVTTLSSHRMKAISIWTARGKTRTACCWMPMHLIIIPHEIST